MNDEAVLSEEERAYLERAFTYHAPTENQPALYQQIRAEARSVATLIMLVAPHSRERAVALTNLEQAVMWANAAIALPFACNDSSGPKEGACDREKRAVWSALGYEGAPPDSMMAIGEWNIAKSDRGLDGETYYFLQSRGEPGCRVLRA